MAERKQREFNFYMRLELVGILDCPQLWQGILHQHAFYELLYVEHGTCKVSVYGEKISLRTHDILLIQALEPHIFETVEDNTRLIYIGFQCEAGDRLVDYNKVIGSDMKNFEKSAFLAKMLQSAKTVDSLPDELMIMEGLIPIAKWIQERNASSGKNYDPQNLLCRKTIKYIKMNMDRFVSVKEIASSLYVSPHYLGIVFSERMGKTILQYQQSLKMERAALLVRSGKMDLNEISDQLGFSSPQYFSKCFKAFFGIAPSYLKSKTVEPFV